MNFAYQELEAGARPSLRVALMEAQSEAGDNVAAWLRDAGHRCHRTSCGVEFMELLGRETFSVLVIGAAAVDRTAEELLNWVRATLGLSTPTLMLIDANDRAAISWLLHRGADDCSVKPIERLEFLMRLQALVRRSQSSQMSFDLEVGNVRIDRRRQRVFMNGQEVLLTPKEFRLIDYILANLGRTLSRAAIFEAVWGRPSRTDTRTLNTHVSQVRAKLNLTPACGWRLTSAYGHGYRLEYFGDAQTQDRAVAAERAAGQDELVR